MKILGPSTVVQAAIPDIFNNVPKEFHERNIKVFQVRLDVIMSAMILCTLQENATLVCKGLSQVPGLKPVMPAGAMYLMVGIDISHFPEFKDDIDFTKQLLIEQSVFCLPGQVRK